MKTENNRLACINWLVAMKVLLAIIILGPPVRGGSETVSDPLTITVRPEREAIVARDGEEVIIKIDVEALPDRSGRRLPLNIAIVLDRSGSMSGRKLEQACQGALEVVRQLRDEDVLSLVTYDTEVQIVKSARRVGDSREEFRSAIREIYSGGSTALYEGVQEGGRQLEEFLSDKRVNRVILLSDGLANVGPSSPREIARLGQRLAQRGISVSTIGLGADYNELTMTALAEASDANYYYVQDVEKLPSIFERELDTLGDIVARDVRVRIICPRGVEPIEVMGRPEKFEGQEAMVRFAHFNSGQARDLLVRCRVIEPKEAEKFELTQVELEYANELESGTLAQLSKAAKVALTADEKVAEKSIVPEVLVRKQQMENDLAMDRAAELVESGRQDEAERVLYDQAAFNSVTVEQLNEIAPSQAPILAEDTDALRSNAEVARQAVGGEEAKAATKQFRNDAWQRKQSK